MNSQKARIIARHLLINPITEAIGAILFVISISILLAGIIYCIIELNIYLISTGYLPAFKGAESPEVGWLVIELVSIVIIVGLCMLIHEGITVIRRNIRLDLAKLTVPAKSAR